jgi:hypothetical protein
MKVQKILCLVMLLVGVIATFYAFAYCTGSLAELGQVINVNRNPHSSYFTASKGKNDALFYEKIQDFNSALMYCGIVMILLAVFLYITASNKRRNYYITNYIAVGVCAGANIVMSVVLMIMNASWKADFLNIDFEAWAAYNESRSVLESFVAHYSESTTMFDLGFVVYAIVIVASILLVLCTVWKYLLMKGEKSLLNGETVKGGAVA